jgi:uncharacterized protein (TIGR03083 family)
VNHVECCNALEVEVERFAEAMSTVPLDLEVVTCPGWDVGDLAEHLGVIHRWATELVRRRSPERVARSSAGAHRRSVSPEWIREGGHALVATLRAANPNDEMWAWGQDQHVRFWSRRQLHETLVHRMDVELAAERIPRADAPIAIDAIDEFLSNLEKVARKAPALSSLRGRGERLAVRVVEPETLWAITLDEQGFTLSRDDNDFNAELVGPALNMLLVMVGRWGVDRGGLIVNGDATLVDFWGSHSAFD